MARPFIVMILLLMVGSMTMTMTMSAASEAPPEPPATPPEEDYPAAARECDKYAAEAQAQLREVRRLLARIAENQKVETNKQKLVAAFAAYHNWNTSMDRCMHDHFKYSSND